MNAHWTLQQIGNGPTGLPWYALQRHNDAGVDYMVTGYRAVVDRTIAIFAIQPVELKPISFEEYLRQADADVFGEAADTL